jgi:hypothetical protein
VKYVQCVKIWSFDILVLFLMPSVQFLKPCVQFLMDTILNLTIVQFLMKKKGDMRYCGASPISIKGRRVPPISIKGRCTLWECVSLLPNSTKKIVNEIFSTGCSLRQPATVPVGTNTCWHKCVTYLCQRVPYGPGPRSTARSISCVTSLKHLECHGFKSW